MSTSVKDRPDIVRQMNAPKPRRMQMHGKDFCQQEENEGALRRLRDLNNSSGGAPIVSLIGMSLSGAFSEGATDFLTRMANIKFPTPISHGTLSHLPDHSRWMDWNMRIIQAKCAREYWRSSHFRDPTMESYGPNSSTQ